MTVVLIIAVIAAVVIGAVVGFIKKFTDASFYGAAVIITLLLVKLVGSAVKKGSKGYALAVLISAVAVLLILTLVFTVLQLLLKNAVEARKELSHYKNYDDAEENEALILSAVDSGDRRQYKKLVKKRKKIKDSAGIWGFLNRVFGAVSGFLNGLVAVSAVVVCILLFADVSNIGFLQTAFEKSLNSDAWNKTGASLAFDLPLICALFLSIKLGYNGGISSVICTVVIIAMLVGFGFASWSIASSAGCAGAVEGLKNGLLGSFSEKLGGAADTVAKVIIAAILFVLSLIIVIITAIFLPKLTDKLRDGKIFVAVDGVLGAIVLCAFVTVLLIAVGGVAHTLWDLPFMEKFGEYAAQSNLGDGLYTYNPMASVFEGLPIRGWFGNAQQPVE